jgi:hypothetical protein
MIRRVARTILAASGKNRAYIRLRLRSVLQGSTQQSRHNESVQTLRIRTTGGHNGGYNGIRFMPGGRQVPCPTGRIEGGVSFGQYRRITR